MNRSHYDVTFQYPYMQGESLLAFCRRLNGAIHEFEYYVDNAEAQLTRHSIPEETVTVDYQVCTSDNLIDHGPIGVAPTCPIHEIGDAPRDVIRQAFVTIYGPGTHLTYVYQVRARRMAPQDESIVLNPVGVDSHETI